MTEQGMLKILKKYVDKGDAPLIAHKLGYRSNSTVYNWITKQSIPAWNIKRLEEVLNQIKDEKETA